jgi:hypothetical protein
MNTSKPYFNQFALERLKFEIIAKIGYRIFTKADCAKLSDIIIESGHGYISESTLYRLFFQVEKHQPYKSTLDLLCHFLGYKESNEFFEKLASSQQKLHRIGISTLLNKGNGLLFYCIENTTKNALFDFFDETNELDHQFKTDVSVALFDSLLKSSKQAWFFEEFSKNKYIREYFFEFGHDPKFRIKNYDEAYIKYMESICMGKDIQQTQDFIFGNCVLFRYYFLTGNFNEAMQNAKALYNHETDVCSLKNHLYIFPFIRYTAYKLWYLEMTNAEHTKIKEYAWFLIDLCKQMKNNLPMVEKKILFHTVAETFVNSKLPETFHWDLKTLFADHYSRFPKSNFCQTPIA